MAEELRDVTVTVMVDTNKRTEEVTFSGENVTEALDAANQWAVENGWKD